LLELGFRVYGTSRSDEAGSFPYSMLCLDVTDERSVARAVETVLSREGRLDIAVNNAGIALAGPVESTTVPEAQRQFDVNFFGALRMCRAVLPAMRAQGSGYIVSIGSIGGLIAIPFQPMYSASKFALEGMMESLRLEVRRFGIRVVLIEPGDTKTPITAHRILTSDSGTKPAYRSFDAALRRMAEDEQGGPGPEGVARLLERVVNTAEPRLRYTCGPPVQRAADWLKRLLPNSVLEYGMRKYYCLD
jgi:NAD(P)-dependent dehydrogenase (short-subunit alcohol dehydrogenase family)